MVPHIDSGSSDPPCMQRIFLRIINERLHFHVTFRSNDIFNAGGANWYALAEWGKIMGETINIEFGNFVYTGNSLHIYERNWLPDESGKNPNALHIMKTLETQGRYKTLLNPSSY